MTRRKPLPYAAGQSIDDAIMAIGEALRALKPIIDGKELTNSEVMRRTGLAIHCMHESIQNLKEIKETQNPAGKQG